MDMILYAYGEDFIFHNIKRVSWLNFKDGKFLEIDTEKGLHQSFKISQIESFNIKEKK